MCSVTYWPGFLYRIILPDLTNYVNIQYIPLFKPTTVILSSDVKSERRICWVCDNP